MTSIIQPLENALDGLGLMRGETAPMKRFIVGTVGTLGALWVAKPDIMFVSSTGEMRPWSAVSDSQDATSIPVYIPALTAGFIMSTFI